MHTPLARNEIRSWRHGGKTRHSLSNIIVPWPQKVNKLARYAEEAVSEFATKWHMKPKHFAFYNTMSAYLFPHASLERLIAIGSLNAALFFIDDLCDVKVVTDEAHDIDRRIIGDDTLMEELVLSLSVILRTGELPSNANMLQQAFLELRKQFLSLSNESWLLRTIDNLENYLIGTVNPVVTLSQNKLLLDVEQYITARVHDSGMVPTVDLVELARDVYLPDEVLVNDVVRKLGWACCRIGCLMNDIFSYHKEVALEQTRFNLINILMEKHKLSFEDALHEAVETVNGIILEFIETIGWLPTTWDKETDAIVYQYAQGLKDIVTASWHWQMSTNRYRSADSPLPELKNLLA